MKTKAAVSYKAGDPLKLTYGENTLQQTERRRYRLRAVPRFGGHGGRAATKRFRIIR